MKQTLRFRIATAGLAVGLLLSMITTYGAVAYQQSSPASAESEWQQLGESFAAPSENAPVVVEGDTFVLPSSGVELVVGNALEADAPAEGEVADQVIVTAPGVIGAVAVISNLGKPLATYEEYVGGFSESMDRVDLVDLQDDGLQVTAVHRVVNGSQTQYMVISVDAATLIGFHVIEVVITDAEGVADALELVHAEITIDGVPMFARIDAEAIVAIVQQDAQ